MGRAFLGGIGPSALSLLVRDHRQNAGGSRRHPRRRQSALPHQGGNMNGRKSAKVFGEGLSKPTPEKERSEPKSQTKIVA